MNDICTIVDQGWVLSITKWLIKIPWATPYKAFVSKSEWAEIMRAEYWEKLQQILKWHYDEAVSYSRENELKAKRQADMRIKMLSKR